MDKELLMKRPTSACTIVGIAGGSGCGKSTLVDRLVSAIGPRKVLSISMDAYYKNLEHLTPTDRAQFNFDDPQVLDVALLVSHLKMLKSGQAIPSVSYEYDSLKRTIGQDIISAKPVVILEGIFVLAIPSIRELLDVNVYVDTAADLRFIRRCRRDIETRARTFSDIALQYERSVREMHGALIEPSKDYADLVIPLDKSNERALDLLAGSISSLIEHQPARLITFEADDSEMALVPGGEFVMGSTEDQIMQMMREYGAQIHWFNDERPVHRVTLPSFYIDKYPVSNSQYRRFIQSTRRNEPETWNASSYSKDNLPVTGVSWEDALAYAQWAGKRLLTECEWEKAARGLNARLFPWGCDTPEGKANFGGKYRGPTAVNKFPDGVSPYGVFDMAGNVWEWINDWYDRDYYSHSDAHNPRGPLSGNGRGVRGGAWINNPTMLRCAERDFRREPHRDLQYFGFRCGLDLT